MALDQRITLTRLITGIVVVIWRVPGDLDDHV